MSPPRQLQQAGQSPMGRQGSPPRTSPGERDAAAATRRGALAAVRRRAADRLLSNAEILQARSARLRDEEAAGRKKEQDDAEAAAAAAKSKADAAAAAAGAAAAAAKAAQAGQKVDGKRYTTQVIPSGVTAGRIGKTFHGRSRLDGRGLHNPANRCYRNALLQCLFHAPEFSHFMGNIHKDCSKRTDRCITCTVQLLTQRYWNGTRAHVNACTNALDRALKHVLKDEDSVIASDAQSDPFDLLGHFARYFELDSTGIDPSLPNDTSHAITTPWTNNFAIGDLFNFNYETMWKCVDCGEAAPPSNFTTLGLDAPMYKTTNNGVHVKDLLKDPIAGLFSEVLPLECESEACQAKMQEAGYVRPDQTRRRRITKAPEILVLRLRRFAAQIDSFGDQVIKDGMAGYDKLRQRVVYPEHLDLTELAAPIAGKVEYRLRGVATHKGASLQSGHYIAGVLMPGTENQYRWLNDITEEPVTNKPDSLLRPVAGRHGEPYILVYSKKP